MSGLTRGVTHAARPARHGVEECVAHRVMRVPASRASSGWVIGAGTAARDCNCLTWQRITGRTIQGRKIRVVFTDGEILVGTTQGYDSKRPGFFVFPADTDANNDRVFVLQGATREVAFI